MRSHARGYGVVCLNAASMLQLSWLAMLAFLGGSAWPPIELAIAGHYFALAFLVFAPIGYGVMALSRAEPEYRGRLFADFIWRCFIPLASYAIGVKVALRMLPSLTPMAITALMGASVPLAIYGEVLRRERSQEA